MIRLFLVFVLVCATTTSTFADPDRSDNTDADSAPPVTYEIPVFKMIKQIMDFGLGVREFLNDPEVSERIQRVFSGEFQEGLSKGIGCVESRLFEVMNDRSTNIGKGISTFFMGNPVNITSFLDLLRPLLNPFFLFNFSSVIHEMNIFKMLEEAQRVFQQITEKCGDEAIGSFRGEIDFLYKKAGAIYDKYTNTAAS